jgi:hypothetical protein
MKTKLIFAGLLMTALAILVTGCSPTGWSTKSIPDGSSLNSGEQVTIVKTDGSVVSGEFTGKATIPSSDYRSLYSVSTMRPVNGRYLPSIGQTVRITTAISDTRAWTGQLIGFDGVNILLKNGSNPEIEKIYFASLTTVSDYDGRSIPRSELRSLFENGSIPLMTAISVSSNGSTTLVPLSAIREITVEDQTAAAKSQTATVLSGTNLRNTLLQ